MHAVRAGGQQVRRPRTDVPVQAGEAGGRQAIIPPDNEYSALRDTGQLRRGVQKALATHAHVLARQQIGNQYRGTLATLTVHFCEPTPLALAAAEHHAPPGSHNRHEC